MFGRWQLEVRVAGRGRMLTHTFTINLRLPAALVGEEGER